MWQLNLLSSTGRWIKTISWDRLDSSRGYVDGNCVPCCGGCNRVKPNVFTAEEMRLLGPVVRAVLSARVNSDGVVEEVVDLVGACRELLLPGAAVQAS